MAVFRIVFLPGDLKLDVVTLWINGTLLAVRLLDAFAS